MVLKKGRGLLMVLLALCFTHPYTPLRILFTDYEGIYRMFSLSQPASMKMSQNVRKEFNSHRIFWNTYMAAVSLFETPMCNMMSCENTLQFKYLTSYTIKGVGLSIPSPPPPPPQPPIEACFESEKIQITVFSLKGHSFPRVHQGSLSSSKVRSFESLSLLFLPVGWQVS